MLSVCIDQENINILLEVKSLKSLIYFILEKKIYDFHHLPNHYLLLFLLSVTSPHNISNEGV